MSLEPSALAQVDARDSDSTALEFEGKGLNAFKRVGAKEAAANGLAQITHASASTDCVINFNDADLPTLKGVKIPPTGQQKTLAKAASELIISERKKKKWSSMDDMKQHFIRLMQEIHETTDDAGLKKSKIGNVVKAIVNNDALNDGQLCAVLPDETPLPNSDPVVPANQAANVGAYGPAAVAPLVDTEENLTAKLEEVQKEAKEEDAKWTDLNDETARLATKAQMGGFRDEFDKHEKAVRTVAGESLEKMSEPGNAENMMYTGFLKGLMGTNADRVGDLVDHAGAVETANFVANRDSHAYTQDIEDLSKQLEFTHDKMGLNTQFGYNQIRSVVSEGKSVGQNAGAAIVVALPLPYDDATDDKGSFFMQNEAKFTPYGRQYLGIEEGIATGQKKFRSLQKELEDTCNKYPDYKFAFCFHLNQGADALIDQRFVTLLRGENPDVTALKKDRLIALQGKLKKIEDAIGKKMSTTAGTPGDHFTLVNQTADQAFGQDHHTSHFPLGLIILYGHHNGHGDPEAPEKCDTAQLKAYMEEQPVGRLSYEFTKEALYLPKGEKADSNTKVKKMEDDAGADDIGLDQKARDLDEATRRIKEIEAERNAPPQQL